MMPSRRWLFEQKIKAAHIAREWLADPMAIIWDSETTGLHNAHFVQIAAIDLSGEPLLNTYIDPQFPIPEEAKGIHHIDDDMVVGAPTFRQAFPLLHDILSQRNWIIYNWGFDAGVLSNQEALAWGVQRYFLSEFGYRASGARKSIERCAMHLYAQFHGDWSSRHGSFTWKKLVHACGTLNVNVDLPPHSALGDCLRTLGVIRAMSAWLDQPYIKELLA